MDCDRKASKTEGRKLPRQKDVEFAFWVAAEFNRWKNHRPGTGASGVTLDLPWSLPAPISVCCWKGTLGILSSYNQQFGKFCLINKLIDVVAIKEQFTCMDESARLWLRSLVCTWLIYLSSFLWAGHHPCVEFNQVRRWGHASHVNSWLYELSSAPQCWCRCVPL